MSPFPPQARGLDTSASNKPTSTSMGILSRAPLRIRRAGERVDVFAIAFEPATSLIRASATGCWSPEETEQYIAGLTSFVRESQLALGLARVLLDRRGVTAQSATVANLLAKANGEIFHPADKIALVVSTSIAKMSLRQRMPHPGSKAFLSIEAAETWLQAFARWK